jgi:hypothetical protein
MYLQLNDTEGTSIALGDGQRMVRYQRAGLSVNPPDARCRPGRIELESHLKDADTFPAELSVEFVHTGQVYKFVRSSSDL